MGFNSNRYIFEMRNWTKILWKSFNFKNASYRNEIHNFPEMLFLDLYYEIKFSLLCFRFLLRILPHLEKLQFIIIKSQYKHELSFSIPRQSSTSTNEICSQFKELKDIWLVKSTDAEIGNQHYVFIKSCHENLCLRRDKTLRQS